MLFCMLIDGCDPDLEPLMVENCTHTVTFAKQKTQQKKIGNFKAFLENEKMAKVRV